jgi:hypothetical protein
LADSIVFSTAPTPAEVPAAEAAATEQARPEWLPENFKSPEDLAASYKTLQAELTKMKGGSQEPPKVEDAPAGTATEDKPADPPEGVEEQNQALADNGIDITSLEAEFAKDGKLSEASYERLAKMGLSKEYVDGQIALRVEAGDRAMAETLSIVGGQEQFTRMAEWARGNYSPAQLQAYNEAVDSGDRGKTELALKALKSDFEKAKGVVPRLLTPTAGATPNAGSYASMSQFLADVNTPLYRSDPAERERVAAKLARSRI